MQKFFFIFLFFPSFLAAKLSVPCEIQAESVIVINGKTGKVIWEKNSDLSSFPASTTKMATAFFALMKKPNALQEKIIAPREALIMVKPSEKMQANYTKCPSFWLETDGSHVGIRPGQVLTFEELLLATLISSGNDASNIIAQTVSGSIELFVEELNRFVKNLGCTNTHFCNPHGLHHPDHRTTARDLARIAQCAMYHPFFKKAVAMTKYEKPATTTQPRLLFVQTNKLLLPGRHYYPYAIGIKTGYTSKSGHCVVAAAEKGDRMVIAAILRGKTKDSRWQDAKALFDACFQEEKVELLLLPEGDQQFSTTFAGAKNAVQTYTKEPIRLSYYPSEEPEVRTLLVWDMVPLPIEEGAKVGEIRVLADGKEHTVMQLYAKNRVEETFTARIGRLFSVLLDYWTAVLAAVAVLVGGYVVVRRR